MKSDFCNRRSVLWAAVVVAFAALVSHPLQALEPQGPDAQISSRKSKAGDKAASEVKSPSGPKPVEAAPLKTPASGPLAPVTKTIGETLELKSEIVADKKSDKLTAQTLDKKSNAASDGEDESAAEADADEFTLSLSPSDGTQPTVKKASPAQAEQRPVPSAAVGTAVRPDEAAVKVKTVVDDAVELSIEAQQAKDEGGCPGSEEPDGSETARADDLPLDQEEHPFDAPAAESEAHVDESAESERKLPPVEKPDNSSAELSSEQKLHRRINLCLAHYFTHQENLALRSPWAVMHTILPFGVETDIIAGNRNVNAIGWMCYNGVCKTQRMFQPTQRGFRTNVGPGVQGHEGQFLAILAQSSVPRNFPILVGKTRYTVSDLIRYEMVTCRENSELTFKLIGLSHYLSPRQTWRDDRGQPWNLEKLVREELEQPVVGAACGGTHRLMGLSYSLMMRRRYKEPIVGHWARADTYIQDFVQYAWSLQNPDGSFSTEWFEGRANEPNMERKVQTSGHILEWLIFTLPAQDLQDPRVTAGIEFLLSEVYDHRDKDWPIGPRGHALRALALYNQRMLGTPTGQLKSHLAKSGFVKTVDR